MIIKKYIGKTEENAVEVAKKELGKNIVIMNVRNVKRNGLFSSFRPKIVEITVALEDEKEQKSLLEEPVKTAVALPQTNVELSNKLFATPENSNNIEEKLDSLQTLLVNQFQKSENDKKEAKEYKDNESTVADDTPSSKEPEHMAFIRLLYNKMIDSDIDEKYANQIMEEIEKLCKPNMPFDNTLVNTYQKMILKFGESEGIIPAKEGPKVVFFIGPTGVGKTTTIAKIASNFALEEKKKIVLLTADTYRIAAAEQLRTYANILEVPFRVVYTDQDMQTAVSDFSQYDYIFVDTAGHSHKNEKQINQVIDLIHSVDNIAERQVFLVVSANTKYSDLIRIANSYNTLEEYKLIFTKLDETTTLGNLYNLKLHTNAPIAYITLGQNVPDDIEPFNPQKTVKQLLGGRN